MFKAVMDIIAEVFHSFRAMVASSISRPHPVEAPAVEYIICNRASLTARQVSALQARFNKLSKQLPLVKGAIAFKSHFGSVVLGSGCSTEA